MRYKTQVPTTYRNFLNKGRRRLLLFVIYPPDHKQIFAQRVAEADKTLSLPPQMFVPIPVRELTGKGIAQTMLNLLQPEPVLKNRRRWMLAIPADFG